MKKVLLKNAKAIVTCDDRDRQLFGYDLLIEAGTITAIEKNLKDPDAEVINAEDLWVYPGLVNTHHHFYQVLTRNIPEIQKLELFDWLLWLYERWRYLTSDMLHAAAMVAMAELVKYGATTIFDHHYVFPQGEENLIDREFEAAATLGVRLHASRGSMSLGKSHGGLPPDDLVQRAEDILADSERLIRKYHDSSHGAMTQVVLAPCSPFSVDREIMVKSAALARKYGIRLHTHLAETADEVDFCIKTLGDRPLGYMESVNWVGEDVFYAHGIFFNDEELERLAQTGTGIAHCPISNMKLASGVARISEMLPMDIPVGLAVDGSASNDSSNLLAEIRSGYLLQRLAYKEKAPSAYEFLKIATRGGARILGREDIGSLEVGKCADMFFVKSDSVNYAGCADDPGAVPGVTGINEPVFMTMVGGEIIYREGEFTHINEEDYVRRVNDFSKVLR
ncbi:MAG: hydroxydechloroatrazine ethylaminohydrolase [delta proteobacterium ML8_F1]|nr:MAG: hydroxydechloroatrazine ethylaminohydrolase [delta proteobacterium ML8_F1]